MGELLVLQARKKYGGNELTRNHESKNLEGKEDLSTVSSVATKAVSTEKSLTAAGTEAGANGENTKLETLEDGIKMKDNSCVQKVVQATVCAGDQILITNKSKH